MDIFSLISFYWFLVNSGSENILTCFQSFEIFVLLMIQPVIYFGECSMCTKKTYPLQLLNILMSIKSSVNSVFEILIFFFGLYSIISLERYVKIAIYCWYVICFRSIFCVSCILKLYFSACFFRTALFSWWIDPLSLQNSPFYL